MLKTASGLGKGLRRHSYRDEINAKTAKANDSFRGTLVSCLREDDYVALPAGAPVASSGPRNTLNFRGLAHWAFWWTQLEQLIL